MVLFDEFMFPHCPDYRSPGHTQVGREYPSEDNIPPEDGWFDDGGAYLPNMPNVSADNVPPSVPQGPHVTTFLLFVYTRLPHVGLSFHSILVPPL